MPLLSRLHTFSPLAILILVAVVALQFLVPAQAATDPWVRTGEDGQPRLQFYFFWSATCPHCQEARPFVEAMPNGRPWLTVHSLELTGHPENARAYQELMAGLGQEAAVPGLVFCGQVRVGWQSAETTGAEILQALDDCHTRTLAGQPAAPAPGVTANTVRLPVLGEIDASALSLPVLTLLLAGLDAFNPCAFFVLLFLLSMMAHQKSRSRMLAVGGIFVLVSGLMYFAFMAAWLNVFLLLGQLTWVTLAAGAMALLAGALNIKDFFAFRRGPSLSLSESGKQDVYRRTRGILAARGLPAMLAATFILAIAANFYELLCTAGFPMVYTRLLTLAEPSPARHYLYLGLYNLIYVLPLAAIVAVFAGTLGARRLSERQGRLLKLLSGLMMLELGTVLLIAPGLLTSAAVGFLLILAALVLTALAARLTRDGN